MWGGDWWAFWELNFGIEFRWGRCVSVTLTYSNFSNITWWIYIIILSYDCYYIGPTLTYSNFSNITWWIYIIILSYDCYYIGPCDNCEAHDNYKVLFGTLTQMILHVFSHIFSFIWIFTHIFKHIFLVFKHIYQTLFKLPKCMFSVFFLCLALIP